VKFVAVAKLGAAQVVLQVFKRIDTLAEPWFATARSGVPSPLKSPTATEAGVVATLKLVAVPKLPAPVPNRIDTVPELPLATARSRTPSPLTSATATDCGFRPTLKLVAVPKLTVPHPTACTTRGATRINPIASAFAACGSMRRL